MRLRETIISDRYLPMLARSVLDPAQRESTGEARLRNFFQRWLDWIGADKHPGGCPLISASVELSDRPGERPDQLVAPGEQLSVKVLEVDRAKRRLALSVRRVLLDD